MLVHYNTKQIKATGMNPLQTNKQKTLKLNSCDLNAQATKTKQQTAETKASEIHQRNSPKRQLSTISALGPNESGVNLSRWRMTVFKATEQPEPSLTFAPGLNSSGSGRSA